MNFLELCQRVRQDSGVSGDIASVTGQQGILAKLVTWVREADLEIQRESTQWKFMWRRAASALVVGKQEYLPGDLGMQPFASINKVYVGTNPLSVMDWDLLESELLCSATPAQGEPSHYAISHDGLIVFNRKPLVVAAVTIRYYLLPLGMTTNESVSPVPVEFHEAIVQRALQSYASNEQDDQLQRDAMAQFDSISKEMAGRFLPKITFSARGFY